MNTEFHYRIPWRTRSAHPGIHHSSQTGGEQEFHGHAPLMSRPEAHNIDVHATLHDPFGQFVVRTYRQRGIIHVNLIADLSASMSFQNKMQILADFTEAAAFSSYRSGDHFAFFGYDEQLHDDFYLPGRWYKGGTPDLAEKLRHYQPTGQHCAGMLDCLDYLPRLRSLIFLVSDFHFPLAEISRVLDSLIRHDVIPIVIWQRQEYEGLPDWGLCSLKDPETLQIRSLVMRPALKEKIKSGFEQRRKQLQHLFLSYGRQPFFITGQFHADHMTRYFYEQ